MNEDLEPLIGENRNLLLQTRELIERLDEQQYQRAHPEIGSNSLGEHVRHLIEHYDAFLHAGDAVDYDRRQRNPEPQRATRIACQRIDELCEVLDGMTGAGVSPDSPMLLRYYPDAGAGDTELALPTSVARELAFVASHTLHHMALIRMLAVHMGVELPEDFGVARATRVQDTGRMPAARAG